MRPVQEGRSLPPLEHEIRPNLATLQDVIRSQLCLAKFKHKLPSLGRQGKALSAENELNAWQE